MHVCSIGYSLKSEIQVPTGIVTDLDRNDACAKCNSSNPCIIITNSSHDPSSMCTMTDAVVTGSCIIVWMVTIGASKIPAMPIVDETIAIVINTVEALIKTMCIGPDLTRILIDRIREIRVHPIGTDIGIGHNHG